MNFHSWHSFITHNQDDKPYVNRALLGRVWQFARPYRLYVLGLLGTIAMLALLGLVTPLLFRDLIDNALPGKNGTRLNWLALGMVLVPIVSGLVGVLQRQWSAWIGEGIIYDLRRALYDHMQRMSLRFYTETRTGELMSRLNNDVVGAQNAITGTLVSIVSNLVTALSILMVMAALEWRLTLLTLAVVPLFVVMVRPVARILRGLRRRSMVANAEMNARMNETLNVSGALLIKIFGRSPHESARFGAEAAIVRDIGVRSAVVGRSFMMVLSLGSAIGVAAVYWLGGRLVLADHPSFTIGTIVAFGAFVSQLYGPLTALANAPVEFAQSMVSFERVFEALDIPAEIVQKPGAVVLGQAQGALHFENVSFRYGGTERVGLTDVTRFGWNVDRASLVRRGREREEQEEGGEEKSADTLPAHYREWALEALSFTIEPGQLVALVGPSGAGKSSVTWLIPRLYDVTTGAITLDGHDLRDLTLDSLAANIGMVTQETYLFYDTIRANLLYANPTATEGQMVAAAQAANIHDFVAGLPEGYDTVVGERGYRLSGGERQRIAIARVLLKDPRILVLDEATSNLDSLSEALIQEALGRVMAERTTIVIAHRLSTILSADKILVLDQGRIVEQGTHDQLLALNGLYTALYQTRFRDRLLPEAEEPLLTVA
jgi:ATP-binding cassette subfamily B protein